MSKLDTTSHLQEPTFKNAPLDFNDLLGIARRGWLYMAIGTTLGLTAAILLLTKVPPSYKANTRLVLEQSANAYLQSYNITDGPSLGDERYSQINVIPSEQIVLPVIKNLKLDQDPEFGCAPASEKKAAGFPGNIIGEIRKVGGSLKAMAGLKPPGSTTDDCSQSTIFTRVISHLNVWWESMPMVINVSFESKDPAKAALIANAIAKSYINTTLESKRSTAKLATSAMQDRLAELRAQAAKADRQVLDYKLSNNVVNADPKVFNAEQMNSLSEQIAGARLAVLDARIKLEAAQNAEKSNSSLSYIPDNELIIQLRNKLLETQSNALDMQSRVGPRHAATVKLNKRIGEINAAIDAERKRIAHSYAAQFAAAQAKYKQLTSTVTQTLTEEASNDKVNSGLRELEATATKLRTAYSALLQRVSEANRLEGSPVVLPYARILTHATIPTQTESSKKRLIVLAGGSMFGLGMGAALAFLLNFPLGVFRTANQVKRSLGLMTVVVPKIDKAMTKTSEYALDMPYSRFAESLRFLWSLISTVQREKRAKVICVATSLEGEGKTTIAANLANQIAKHAGIRTLLIDADFHHRSLTRAIARQADNGLREALDDPENFTDYVVTVDRTGVDVLPCPLKQRIPDAAQLLGSNKMEELLRRARASYDLIIIEPPPIAILTDCRMLAPFCDAFLFVIEWGKTSQRLVLETIAEVPELWERVLCVVLNKADPAALKNIERYKGPRYRSYFRDDVPAKNKQDNVVEMSKAA